MRLRLRVAEGVRAMMVEARIERADVAELVPRGGIRLTGKVDTGKRSANLDAVEDRWNGREHVTRGW